MIKGRSNVLTYCMAKLLVVSLFIHNNAVQASSIKQSLPAIYYLLADNVISPPPPQSDGLTAEQHQLLYAISRQVAENLAYTVPIYRDDVVEDGSVEGNGQGNIDGDIHYYDAPLRFQFHLQMALGAGHITPAQANNYQSQLDIYYENLRSAIEAGTPDDGEDGIMNKPQESYLRGLTNYYLASKHSRQNFKQTILAQAKEGNIILKYADLDPGHARYGLIYEYIRPYALAMSSLVQALRIYREDGQTIPAAMQAKFDNMLPVLKGTVSQFLTGEYQANRAWKTYTQLFYHGLALTALIDAHEYLDHYDLPQDDELQPLIKAVVDQFLLGGGQWYRYTIPTGVAVGDTFEYRVVLDGSVSPNIIFQITQDDLTRGYLQFSVPQATMETQASVVLVNGTQSTWTTAPQITPFHWLDKSGSVDGFWAFRWGDVPNDNVSLSNTTLLANFLSPAFAWLHSQDLVYDNNQSYQQAYWQTFFSTVISGHLPREFYAMRSPAGKSLNQAFFNQAKAWEYLGFDASRIKPPQYQSLPVASNGTKMTDVGFTLHPYESQNPAGSAGDDTVIENGYVRLQTSGHVYLQSDFAGLKFEHTLAASSSVYSDANGLRHSFGDIFFTLHNTDRIRIITGTGGNPYSTAPLEGTHDLVDGERYIFGLERLAMTAINPDTQRTDKSLLLMHYDNQDGSTIGTGIHKHDNASGTQIGLHFSTGANVDYSSIQYFEN